MGEGADALILSNKINQSFHANNIAATSASLSPLKPSADFLTICHTLGHLDHLIRTDLNAYRRALKMPPLQRRIMTLVFRQSLLRTPTPWPLHITIKDGPDHGIEVSTTDDLISLVVTRTPPPFRTRARAKPA
jgi:hypothetical protein